MESLGMIDDLSSQNYVMMVLKTGCLQAFWLPKPV